MSVVDSICEHNHDPRFRAAVTEAYESGKAAKEESSQRALNAAVSVIRAASIGDQNFIPCLRGEGQQTTRLRLAIVELAERLRETRSTMFERVKNKDRHASANTQGVELCDPR